MSLHPSQPDIVPGGAFRQRLNLPDITASQAWGQALSPDATQNSTFSQDVFNPTSTIFSASMIPGLGLSFSTEPVQTRDEGASRADAERCISASANQKPMDLGVDSAIVDPKSIMTAQTEGKAQDDDDGLEEGEISEGENEGTSGIGYTAVDDDGSRQDHCKHLGLPDVAMAEIDATCPPTMSAASLALPTNLIACGGQSQIPDNSRERSTSYSPCLSPGELIVDVKRNLAAEGNAPKLRRKMLEANSMTKALKSQTLSQRKTTAGIRKSQKASKRKPIHHRSSQSFVAARRKALDAILKLMPINVQYQTLIAEGIDVDILDSLFEDLGLPKNTSAQAPKDLASLNQTDPASTELPSNLSALNLHCQNTPAEQTTSSSGDVRDKAEERKDRIARLLAAKNQRPNNAANLSHDKASNITEATEQSRTAMSRKITEKSVLLREKMDALAKSRQNSQKPAGSRPIASEVSATVAQPITVRNTTPKIFLNKSTAFTRSGSSASVDEQQNVAVTTSSPLIPRPSSSNDFRLSDRLRSASQRYRPGQVHAFQSNQHARSIAQNVSVRPFLIHVSDGEEDGDEEVDTEHEHNDGEKNDAGAEGREKAEGDARHEVAGLKGQLGDVLQSVASRQKLSPKILASNPTSRSSSSLTLKAAGKYPSESSWELENMNKEIEAMKRKIAEAEARHQLKLSRQASPSAKRQEGDSSRESLGTNMSRSEDARSVSPIHNGTSNRNSPASHTPRPQTRRQISPSVSTRSDTSVSEKRVRSRAASERLPVLEARRRQQHLKLRALQFQIANIQREIEENNTEEERLRKELTSFVEPPKAVTPSLGLIPHSEKVAVEGGEGSKTADVPSKNTVEISKNLAPSSELGRDLELSPFPLESFSNDSPTAKPGSGILTQDTSSINQKNAIAAGVPTPTSPKRELTSSNDIVNDTVMIDVDSSIGETSVLNLGKADAHMTGVADESSTPSQAPLTSELEQATNQLETIEGLSQHDSSKNPQKSIVALDDTKPAEIGREVSISNSSSHFVPYESPLQYFRAYRFHPQYQNAVSGGLRSLTYSNKIDVKRELCPFELDGQLCRDGAACKYQHFADMKAPDDQILVQLGAAGSYEQEQKQEYISGLRRLLTDFRHRKVKDFQTISQAIVEYRGRFRGDRSKILPLDGVSI